MPCCMCLLCLLCLYRGIVSGRVNTRNAPKRFRSIGERTLKSDVCDIKKSMYNTSMTHT